MVLSIFIYNVALSAFVAVTLPGFVFFPLSTAFLLYRAAIWGLLLHCQPTWVLLVALPALVFEGEGYVFAAVAGSVVGISWLRPKWLGSGEGLPRFAALKKALKECLIMYLPVVALIFCAATIESLVLVMTTQ
jgi:hypothetical protein